MKEFFIQHTEKLVLGLCVLVAVWFLYGALTVPQYEKSKQDFEKMIADASRNVNNSEPQLDDLPPLNFDEEVKKLDVTIDSKDYQLPTPFIRPMELGFQFRGTPEILKPEPPEVQVNRGLVVLQERDAKDRGNLKVFQKLLGQNFPAELIWFTGNQDMVENLGIVEVEEKAGPARPQAAGRQNRRGGEVGDGRTEVRRSAKGVIWVEVVAAFPHADQIREYIRSVKEGAEEAGVRYALSEIQRQELTPDLE